MVDKISWEDISDLLMQAKQRVVLIMPGIHEEWLQALQMNENVSKIEIKVCIDNSEESIRSGYGSVESIAMLEQMQSEIKECEGLRINLIVSDEKAFLLFMESRLIAGNPVGYNAIELDQHSSNNIIQQFFPIIDNLFTKQNVPVISSPLSKEKSQAVKEAIKINPPAEPDLKRQINTYTTLFQYAEVSFEGANLQSKTITIPPNALPFKDAELKKRMKTRFNLFSKEQTNKWEALLDIKQKVEALRKKYLTPCKVRKERSILMKTKKNEFLKELSALKTESENLVKKIIDDVQKALHESKDVLKSELTTFFTENQPDDVKSVENNESKNRMIADIVNETLAKTKIPTANSLIKNFKLDTQYAELTVEDLNDKDFLEWFKAKDLINEANEGAIASYEKAFKIKR